MQGIGQVFWGMCPMFIGFFEGSARLVLADGSMCSMVCRAVLLSCVGVSVVCLGARRSHVGRSAVFFMYACGCACSMQDGCFVAPPSYVIRNAMMWMCVWGVLPSVIGVGDT